VGVEKKLFVVHLCSLCQKLFIPLSAEEFRVSRSTPYVSIGRRRPLAIRWQRKGLMPAPGEERRLTNEKMAWARESLCLKWWVEVRAGVNQYPSHLTMWDGWKNSPSSSIGAVEGGVLWLEVRQWMSSVLGTEKDKPMSQPLVAMVEKSPWSRRMFPLWEGEATVTAKSST